MALGDPQASIRSYNKVLQLEPTNAVGKKEVTHIADHIKDTVDSEILCDLYFAILFSFLNYP